MKSCNTCEYFITYPSIIVKIIKSIGCHHGIKLANLSILNNTTRGFIMSRISNNSQLFYEQILASIEEQDTNDQIHILRGLSELIDNHVDYLRTVCAEFNIKQ